MAAALYRSIAKHTEEFEREVLYVIHLYQNNGYNIALDVNSGCVHVLDKIAYDIIGFLENENPQHTPETLSDTKTVGRLLEAFEELYAESDIRDVLEAVIELTKAGQLFTKDIYEDFIDVVKQRKTVVKALCLHIAHDCNLACKYCFAEEGVPRQTCIDVLRGRQESAGFFDCQLRQQTESRSGLFWRRAIDELAGCKGSGGIWKRAGKAP